MDRINFDLSLIGDYDYILGIDEVGWGCVAGSLVLGGALVPKDILMNNSFEWLSEIKDSKKLSDKKRKIILEKIQSQSQIEYAIGETTAEVINQIGLAKAYTLCIEQILVKFSSKINRSKILIDGNREPKTGLISRFELIVKGDDKSVTIGIASNVAKQYRDDSMIQMDNQFPFYDFKNNVGYGTPKHILGLKEHGLTRIHRLNATLKLISDKKG